MSLLDTEEDMKKMYDYIIENDITDTDDIYKYGFKLAGIAVLNDKTKIIKEKEIRKLDMQSRTETTDDKKMKIKEM